MRIVVLKSQKCIEPVRKVRDVDVLEFLGDAVNFIPAVPELGCEKKLPQAMSPDDVECHGAPFRSQPHAGLPLIASKLCGS